MSDTVKSGDENASAKFEAAAGIIKDVLDKESENKILVNCFGGMSRSTSSVLAYLVIHKRIPADLALKQIKVCVSESAFI